MKKILLWDPRFPDRRPVLLNLLDELASAAVRSGVAAAADPSEQGALTTGGPLDPGMLTEVVMATAPGRPLVRVMLPYSAVTVGAGLGVLAPIGTPVPGGPVIPNPPPAPTPTIAFGSATYSVAEGNTGTKTQTIPVTLSRDGLTGAQTVNFAYSGTATSGVDYTAPVSLTLGSSVSTGNLVLTINGDSDVEPDETVVIDAALAGYPAATARTVVTVVNDDVAANPTVAISGAQSKPEGNSGATLYTYTVTRSASAGAVSVPWSFTAGTTNASDYTGGAVPAGGAVAMADGVASGTIAISVNGDAVVEADEQFTVSITVPIGYDPGSGLSATGTIVNDDVAAQTNTVDFMTARTASVPWYNQAAGQNAFADATSNKSYVLFEGMNPAIDGRRSSYVEMIDHTTKAKTGPYRVFDSKLTNDDHGVPAAGISPFNRRMYAFGGAHGSSAPAVQIAMSGVDDFTAWALQPEIPPLASGDSMAYPHPVFVGNRIYLYSRYQQGSLMNYAVTVGTIGSNGTVAWAPTQVLINANGRVYASNPIIISQSGTDAVIRHIWLFADTGDTYRQDIFCFDHDTAAGLIKAVNSSYTFSTAATMTKGTAQTNIRVVNQAATSTYSTIASHAFDSAGNYHILYMDDPDGNNVAPADMDWYWQMQPGGAGAFGARQKLFSTKQRYDTADLLPLPGGQMDALYVSADVYNFQRGGDISRISRPSGGAWGAPVVVQRCSPFAPIERPLAVKDSTPALRFVTGEVAVPPYQGNTSGSDNLTLGNLRTYGFSDDGIISFPFTPHAKVQAWAARAATTPSLAYQKAVDALVSGLDISGFLATMDVLFPLAGLSAADGPAALLDLIGTKDLTVNGGAAFTQVPGRSGYAWQGNGTDGYLQSTYAPATNGTNFLQNSAAYSIGILTESLGAQGAGEVYGKTGGSDANPNVSFALRQADGTSSLRMNGGYGRSFTATSSAAFWTIRRSASGSTDVIKDGTRTGGDGGASAGNSAFPVKLLGDGGTSYSNRQIYGVAFGGPPATSDYLALTALFRRFATDLDLAGA